MGYSPVHTYIESTQPADWLFVGSLIQLLPESFKGKIVGTGLIRNKFHDIPNADVISVRGELTKEVLGLDRDVGTGDLGLISDILIGKNIKQKQIRG